MGGYLILGAFALGAMFGTGGMWAYDDWQDKRHELALAEAQAETRAANEQAQRAIETGMTERQVGYDKGVAEGRAQGARATKRSVAAAQAPSIQNPQCYAPPEAYGLYKAALGSVTGGKIPDELLAERLQAAPAMLAPAPPPAPPMATAPSSKPSAAAPARAKPINPLVVPR
jgi:hypothetical protein